MKLMLENEPIRHQLRDDTDVVRRSRDAERFTPWLVVTVRLVAILQLIIAAASAVGTDLVDYTLYGGAYDSSSATSYSEVVQACFGGLEVGTCEASSPNWRKDFLDQYNAESTGAYCLGCCSNTDTSGDTWAFDCALISTSFADFVNVFGWEFRFARRKTLEDTAVITCPIRRGVCSYNDDGVLTGACDGDGSYLVAYVLTLEVMTMKKRMKTWKSIQSCSVEVEESKEKPSSLSETTIMNQVYDRDGPTVGPGWAVLISAVAVCVLSCAIRFLRDDHCVICAHHLIWFREVCLICRCYGYDPPSEEVKEIMREKRSVVLPDLSLSEAFGAGKAATSKVFGKATTEGLMISRTLMKEKGGLTDNQVLSHEGKGPDTTLKPPPGVGNTRGKVERAADGSDTRPTTLDQPVGTRRNPRFLSPLSSARSVTFADDNLDDSPRTDNTALRKGKLVVAMESDGCDD